MATNTKKILEQEFSKPNVAAAPAADQNDYTAQPQATTAADVNSQNAKTRLWQSLDYSYGRQRDESNKAYDRSISQQDNALLGRGMQRSSYGMQTLANLRNEKANAANDIYSAQIADYQNRIGQIEQQDKEDERWERQFAEGQRQFNENMGFQQSQADRSQSNWEKEFAAGREDTAWNQQFQQGQFDWQKDQADKQQENWEKEFAAGREDAAWNQQWQKEQADRSQQNWEKEFAANREDTAWSQQWQKEQADREQANWDKNFDFQQKQWEAQQAQWREEFDYNKMSDDQKLAYNYAVSILGQGGDPSDDLLARAGLSRADANAMKTQAATSGGRSGKNPKSTDEPANTPTDGDVEQDLLEFIEPIDKTGEKGSTYTYFRDEPKYDKFKPTYVK